MNSTISTIQPLYPVDKENQRPGTDDEDTDDDPPTSQGDTWRDKTASALSAPKYAISAVGTRVTGYPPSSKRSSISTQQLGQAFHASISNTWKQNPETVQPRIVTTPRQEDQMCPLPRRSGHVQVTPPTPTPTTAKGAATTTPATTSSPNEGASTSKFGSVNVSRISSVMKAAVGSAKDTLGSAMGTVGSVAGTTRDTLVTSFARDSTTGSARETVTETPKDSTTLPSISSEPSRASVAVGPMRHLEDDFQCLKHCCEELKEKVVHVVNYDNFSWLSDVIWSGFLIMGGGDTLKKRRRRLSKPNKKNQLGSSGPDPGRYPSGGMSVL